MAPGRLVWIAVLIAVLVPAVTVLVPHEILHGTDANHDCALCHFAHLPAGPSDAALFSPAFSETAEMVRMGAPLAESPAVLVSQPPRAPPA